MKNTKSALILQIIPIVILLSFIVSSFFGRENTIAFMVFTVSWPAMSCGLLFGFAGVYWMKHAKAEGEKGPLYITGWILSIFSIVTASLTVATFAAMLIFSA